MRLFCIFNEMRVLLVILFVAICRLLLAQGFGSSASCNVNANCPEAISWKDVSKSVVLIFDENGYQRCSGVLVNNSREDGRPLVLTSNSCLNGHESQWSFAFQYESEGCRSEDPGIRNMLVGAEIISRNDSSDFALLQLLVAPGVMQNAYFAGWSIDSFVSDTLVCFHHPKGDIKKVALSYDSLEVGGGEMIELRWDLGTTETGSIGAPLFNKDGLVVGILSESHSQCSDSADLFGLMAAHWHISDHPMLTTKYYLDPDSTNILSLNGRDLQEEGLLLDVGIINFENVSYNSCINTFTPKVTFQNLGQRRVDSIQIFWSVSDFVSDTIWIKTNMDFFDQYEFRLPRVFLDIGQYQYKIQILAVEDTLGDLNVLNNSLDYAFQIVDGNYISLELKTDLSPEENAVYLLDDQGNIKAYFNSFEPEAVSNYEFCLIDGCYSFMITDVFADGICCDYGNGYFLIRDAYGTELKTGGDFGDTMIYDFCFWEEDEVIDTLNNSILFKELGEVRLHQNVLLNPELRHLKIEAFDVLGRLMLSEELNGESFFDLSEIPIFSSLMIRVEDLRTNDVRLFKSFSDIY